MASFKQYEKKNGVKAWMFRAYLGKDDATGKEIRTKRYGFKTKKEAQLALSRLKLDFEKDGLKKAINITFQEAYELWEVNYKNTVKESTYYKTKEMFDLHILPVFSKYKVSKIPVAKAQSFADQMVTILVNYRRAVSDASRVVKFAVNLGYAEENPFDKITMPKRKEELTDDRKQNYYSKEELEIFLSALEKKNDIRKYAFLRTLAFSGMRVGELCALNWEDINFEDKTIRISKTVARGKDNRLYIDHPKAKNSNRTIPMDEKSLKIISRWRIEQKRVMLQLGINIFQTKQLVFPSWDNKFLEFSQPRKWINTIIKETKLHHITIHGFRHTHATMLLEAGSTLKDVQIRLGHARIQITMDLYIHITEKRSRETVDQLVDYMNF